LIADFDPAKARSTWMGAFDLDGIVIGRSAPA
jgi:hypothetical protein